MFDVPDGQEQKEYPQNTFQRFLLDSEIAILKYFKNKKRRKVVFAAFVALLTLSFLIYLYVKEKELPHISSIVHQKFIDLDHSDHGQRIREIDIQMVALDVQLQKLKELTEQIVLERWNYPPPQSIIESIQSKQNLPKLMKALYKDLPNAVEKRQIYFESRVETPSYYANLRNYPEFESIRYILTMPNVDAEKRKNYYETGPQSYAHIVKKFDLKHTQTELPICVIVMHYNNNANFRIQSNMNSIFLQNYTNYKVIIIDDASNDGTPQTIQNYLDFHKISQTKAKLVINQERVNALQNLYNLNLFYCQKDGIVATVDGDDELIGANVFNLINGAYQTGDLAIAYGQVALYNEKNNGFNITGFDQTEVNLDYFEDEINRKFYRRINYRIFNLRTYRNELFRGINKLDLLEVANFLQTCQDQATMYPMLEMACGHSKFFNEMIYLDHRQTAINEVDIPKRRLYQQRIKFGTKPYDCLPKYANKK